MWWSLLGIAVAVLCLVGSAGEIAVGDPHSAAGDQEQIVFLKRHWQSPIPPQGKSPARFSALEGSLDPESCGVCHRPQYDDWKQSVHSKSMGPGVMGQTMEAIQDDPETAVLCYSCHAPLAEQQEKLRDRSGSRSRFRKNPAFLASLQAKGLTCVGCHVRKHRRYGPPKRDGSLEDSLPASQVPHDGAVRTHAFERAEFCKGCHQFEPDGYALNGKLLENTYNEWKEGPSGQEGKACQSCHMPDRRHTWRGIHDPEMVKQGVTVRLALDKTRYQIGDRVQAVLTLANTGVGHYFPTYVTPKVVARFELMDAAGRPVDGSLEEARIGREVTLDLTQELFDTRIPPGETHLVRYARTIGQPGLTLKASVVVIPDDFYAKFFEAIVPKAKTKAARALLLQALDEARRSSFTLFEDRVPLPS
ncbi:MAG: cytochrome c family protein [Acidobacteria bacterium]|nr:cytochrome c family protein [Acidobacteriota bacterium]